MRGREATRLRGIIAAAEPAPSAPPPVQSLVTTVAHVELLEVGEDWETSTGTFTFDVADLASAVAAQDDPSMPAPVIKLGHIDPRFDGQPALGRIINMAAENNGQTLVGDLAGLPTWLAAYMSTLYPRRSIEGQWGCMSRTGNVWPFALTAVALLGDAYPAISTLADIERLLGPETPPLVAASAPPVDGPAASIVSGVRSRPEGRAVAVRRIDGLA